MPFCPSCGFNLSSISTKLAEDTSLSPEATRRGSSEVVGTENEILEGYLGKKEGIAVPKVSDYRERYKTHRLRSGDIKTGAPIVPLVRMDTEMDKFGDLVVGEGIQQEY